MEEQKEGEKGKDKVEKREEGTEKEKQKQPKVTEDEEEKKESNDSEEDKEEKEMAVMVADNNVIDTNSDANSVATSAALLLPKNSTITSMNWVRQLELSKIKELVTSSLNAFGVAGVMEVVMQAYPEDTEEAETFLLYIGAGLLLMAYFNFLYLYKIQEGIRRQGAAVLRRLPAVLATVLRHIGSLLDALVAGSGELLRLLENAAFIYLLADQTQGTIEGIIAEEKPDAESFTDYVTTSGLLAGFSLLMATIHLGEEWRRNVPAHILNNYYLNKIQTLLSKILNNKPGRILGLCGRFFNHWSNAYSIPALFALMAKPFPGLRTEILYNAVMIPTGALLAFVTTALDYKQIRRVFLGRVYDFISAAGFLTLGINLLLQACKNGLLKKTELVILVTTGISLGITAGGMFVFNSACVLLESRKRIGDKPSEMEYGALDSEEESEEEEVKAGAGREDSDGTHYFEKQDEEKEGKDQIKKSCTKKAVTCMKKWWPCSFWREASSSALSASSGNSINDYTSIPSNIN